MVCERQQLLHAFVCLCVLYTIVIIFITMWCLRFGVQSSVKTNKFFQLDMEHKFLCEFYLCQTLPVLKWLRNKNASTAIGDWNGAPYSKYQMAKCVRKLIYAYNPIQSKWFQTSAKRLAWASITYALAEYSFIQFFVLSVYTAKWNQTS